MKKLKYLIIGAGIVGAIFAYRAFAITICSPIQGCTGSSSTPALGQILLGNNGGTYTPIYITAGSNITVTTSSAPSITISAAGGSGSSSITINGITSSTFNITASTSISIVTSTNPNTISIANTGVTQLTGTTNQIAVSASTGAITLTLPSIVSTNTLNASNTLIVVGTSTLTGNVFMGGTLNVTSTATFQATTTAIANFFVGGTLNVTSTATFQATSTDNANHVLKTALASSPCLNTNAASVIASTTCVTSVASGTGINVSAASGAVTVNIITPVTVANGGTGTSTTPTDSQLLSASGTAPAWKTLIVNSPLTAATTSNSLTLSCGACVTSTAATIPSSTQVTFTAGVALNAGQAVYVAGGAFLTDTTLVTSTLGTTVNPCMYPRATQSGDQGAACAAKVTTSTNALTTGAYVPIKLTGSPSGNIVLELVPDNSGSPSSTILASTSVSIASLTTTGYTITGGNWNSAFTMVGGTNYWLLVTTSTQGNSDSNYFNLGTTGSSNGQTNSKVQQSGVYNGQGDVAQYQYQINSGTTTIAGEIYPTMGLNATSSAPFIGFVPAAASQASSASVIIGGIATSLSGLTTANQEYLSNVPGNVMNSSTISGDFVSGARKACIAVTSTQCLVTNIW